jgi:hypothetical protein
METLISLTPTQCALRFHDGTLLTIAEDGVIALSKSGATLICEPMRLRGDLQTFGSATESFFGSEKLVLSEKLSLSILVDYCSGKLRVELFFTEGTERTERSHSGCYITKEQGADWAVRFLEAERFLCHLSALLGSSAGFCHET